MCGDTLRMLRIERQVTVEQLADAVAVTPQAIEYYEKNIWQPGKPTLARLASFLGVSVGELDYGYSLLYDDETHEKLLVRNMGDNRIRVIGRIAGRSSAAERKEGAGKCLDK